MASSTLPSLRVLAFFAGLALAGSAQAAPDPHGILERMQGTWQLQYQIWLEPGKDPIRERGIETHRWSADGLFQISDFDGEMFGAPYFSAGITSFDPATETFYTWYFDASNQRAQVSEGRYDPKKGVLVKWSDGLDFAGNPVRWKQELAFPTARTYRLDMYTVKKDEEPVLAIRCTGQRLDVDARRANVDEVVDGYLAAYAARDIERMTAYYTDSSLFEDPTYVALDPSEPKGLRKTGRREIAAMLTEGLRETFALKIDVASRFRVGDRVILTGRLNSVTAGKPFGREDLDEVPWSLSFVTVLRVAEGKIVHHLDFIDYTTAIRHLREIPRGGTEADASRS